MPLHDAFSAGSSIRLARMSTVPTTDDLKYLLAESRKNAKPVELPFENNRTLFVIKVTLTAGQAQTPRWTLQKGDGNTAKILWTRDSTEVMMIQNKIKVESAYDSTGDGEVASQPAQDGNAPIITGGPQPTVMQITRRNFAGWPGAPTDEPATNKVLVPPKPLPLAGFTAEFVKSKETWPQVKDEPQNSEQPESAEENLAQVRSFAKKTMEQLVIPFLNAGHAGQSTHKGSPDSGKMNTIRPVAEIDTATGAKVETAGSATKGKKTEAVPSVSIPLPPPVRFADSLVDHVFNRLFDRNTGLMFFGTLVFFLLREFDRHQRKNSGLSIVICEAAIKRDGKICGIPYEALPIVAERIRTVCKPHHIAAHVSGSEFAILLEESDEESLTSFCEALFTAVSAAPPLLEGLASGSTRVAIGAASIPNTCTDPGVLVAAAEMAKEMAKEKTPSYLLFPARSDLA